MTAIVAGPDAELGNVIGDSIGGIVSSELDQAMKAVWDAATWLLSAAFGVADTFSTFTVDAHSGAVGAVWPTLLSVSAAVALGLFFWQLTLSALRGGRGMMRVATGPIAYGISLSMTVAGVAAALATADGLTTLILSKGLNVANFSEAFTHTSVGGQILNGVKAVALGLIGFFGLVPAAIGWVLEIIWRQAAILVLVATVPVTAAGLLAHTTSSWFWHGLRWTIAAITVKPLLALIVAIGLSSVAGASGPIGLLAGVGVLWVSLAAPFALFRLLAFVDPGTDAGQAFRDGWSQLTSRLSGGTSGGADLVAGGGGRGGPTGGSADGTEPGGISAFESANTARFDAAGVGSSGQVGSGDDSGEPPPPPANMNTGAASSTGPVADSGGSPSAAGTSAGAPSSGDTEVGAGGAAPGDDGGTQSGPPAVAAPPSDTEPAHPTPYPRPTGDGADTGSAGAAGGEAAGGAAEATVIL